MSDDLKVETLTPEEIARACDESAVHPFHASICRVCLQRLILAAEARGRQHEAHEQAIESQLGKRHQLAVERAEAAEARLRELQEELDHWKAQLFQLEAQLTMAQVSTTDMAWLISRLRLLGQPDDCARADALAKALGSA